MLATVFGCLSALMSILIFLRLYWPSPVLWILKLFWLFYTCMAARGPCSIKMSVRVCFLDIWLPKVM